MMSGGEISVFRDAMHRYTASIEILEGVTRYLADASSVVESCADLLRNPQRIGNDEDSLRGTLWFNAADLDAMLAQWRVCVDDAWVAWNALPGHLQKSVAPPRFGMISDRGKFFKQR